jgi:hypothetical protein
MVRPLIPPQLRRKDGNMPDITMCEGSGCKIKEQCYRFRASPTPHRQSFFLSPPFKENGDCEHYWPFRHNARVGSVKHDSS